MVKKNRQKKRKKNNTKFARFRDDGVFEGVFYIKTLRYGARKIAKPTQKYGGFCSFFFLN